MRAAGLQDRDVLLALDPLHRDHAHTRCSSLTHFQHTLTGHIPRQQSLALAWSQSEQLRARAPIAQRCRVPMRLLEGEAHKSYITITASVCRKGEKGRNSPQVLLHSGAPPLASRPFPDLNRDFWPAA